MRNVGRVFVNWKSGRSFDQNDAHFGRMTVGADAGMVGNEREKGRFNLPLC